MNKKILLICELAFKLMSKTLIVDIRD